MTTWHNSNEEQPDGDRVIVCYHTPTNMFGDVGKYSLLKPNYRWAYLGDLDPEYKKISEYFYCKYGGCIPLCSDCERNHNNSHFNTEDIENWFVPQKGTKQCKDYMSYCADCVNDKGCIVCEHGEQKQILAKEEKK